MIFVKQVTLGLIYILCCEMNHYSLYNLPIIKTTGNLKKQITLDGIKLIR